MKKVTYIVFGLVFLALASCQKESFGPSESSDQLDASKIEWKSSDMPLDKTNGKKSSLNDKALDQSSSTSSGFDTGGSTDTESGITDPNNDPDAGRKKGKK